ncbi:hypothetical protein A2673_03405 [Candidatus Kaiserbacteria bacterium RIFCSPHIGHO2_01_FULL_50_13]|uniref:Uncharacterized protein n=1 Tax=Candidatus Kaiserbacteria bacterium RIFCSPLOWO2_01_FULL_50_24 TaxID=1798507 RepID=A0A1F6EML9_9BACT|nr:MAG: hypothetical protein A2673_03405 [Candidatus Kaiserbacteria bacterium RIFCSPHIGHO2_01_FULL_50_13]OGG74875.1 MAG: hypothetical protein A3A34_03580 [Candidatus Kaiserbacteria bacterium RIFCSPLOWO2_01_FULL_50_24]OGG81612.1 MAG: hypothetical protein A3H74_01365 [Candidatus Kaiserbacteria bacterium RIFCSPLOWO2_02_FULL_51_13]
MKTRTLVYGMVLSGAIATTAFLLGGSVHHVEIKDAEARVNFQNALVEYERTTGNVAALAKGARMYEDWENIRRLSIGLPDEAKAYFALVADLKTLEFLAEERDRLLANAGELYAVNQKDAGIQENIEKARAVHLRAEALVEGIKVTDGEELLLALLYRKAYEKYRSLAFLGEKQASEALSILDDAVQNLRQANDVSQKHNRVELALEFLYKKTKEEEAKQSSGQAPSGLRAIPPRREGPDGPNTGSADRPRLH